MDYGHLTKGIVILPEVFEGQVVVDKYLRIRISRSRRRHSPHLSH